MTRTACIVDALRKLADEIEAGSDPNCYASGPETGIERCDTPDEAHDYAQAELDGCLDDDEWGADVDCVEWGVLVPIEVSTITRAGRPKPGSGTCAWLAYALRPVDDTTLPVAEESECEECGHEEAIAPHAPCSVCGHVAAGADKIECAAPAALEAP